MAFFLVEVPKVCFFLGGGEGGSFMISFSSRSDWQNFIPTSNFCMEVSAHLWETVFQPKSSRMPFYQQKITGQRNKSRLGVVWHVWPQNPISFSNLCTPKYGLKNWIDYFLEWIYCLANGCEAVFLFEFLNERVERFFKLHLISRKNWGPEISPMWLEWACGRSWLGFSPICTWAWKGFSSS